MGSLPARPMPAPATRATRRPLACAATAALALVAVCLEAGPAPAQGVERIVTPPPAATILRARPGVPEDAITSLGLPPAFGGEAVLDLNIQYTDAKIYNPGTNQYDAVRLRSYRDAREAAPPKVPFVAPTIEIVPDETVRITLHNTLPQKDPSCPAPDSKVNTPHCFNSTNLHSHGLWVSPAGNGDNVLVSINPTVSFQYEYNVPPDHPAGTFWYHPHLHGSTALQVSSGMAGVLIVNGSRFPTPQSTGDVDTLLKEATGAPFTQRIVLLQQIQYACRTANGTIEANPDGTYLCKSDQTGGIEGYDQFGPGSWPASGRYTSINGEVIPTFAGAQVGRIERWRIAHAGVRDTVKLQFRKMRPGAGPYAQLSTAQQADWVAENCPGDALAQFSLASDGLTRGQITQRPVTVLQPGYREDLLMIFPEAGDYCVIDDQAPANATVNALAKSRKYLGRVNVGVGQSTGNDLKAYLRAQLMAAASRTMPPAVRQMVRDDLANDLRLTSFIPHPDVAASEVKGQQQVELKIDTSGGSVLFEVNGKPYDPTRIDRTLMLGSVDEWTLTSGTNPPVGHPFHIHVNPFQIIRILDPAGNDVSIDGEASDPQYAGLNGVWRDTLFVKPGYHVTTRTRYQRYIGEFVLHCHILDHEDQGMMQNIRIAIPDGTGGVVSSSHH
jgi:L-ascorbate oxidase